MDLKRLDDYPREDLEREASRLGVASPGALSRAALTEEIRRRAGKRRRAIGAARSIFQKAVGLAVDRLVGSAPPPVHAPPRTDPPPAAPAGADAPTQEAGVSRAAEAAPPHADAFVDATPDAPEADSDASSRAAAPASLDSGTSSDSSNANSSSSDSSSADSSSSDSSSSDSGSTSAERATATDSESPTSGDAGGAARPTPVPAVPSGADKPRRRGRRDDEPAEEPIQTRTMARLLAAQGHHRRAAAIYDKLVRERPSDVGLRAEADTCRERAGSDDDDDPEPDEVVSMAAAGGLLVAWGLSAKGIARAQKLLSPNAMLYARVVVVSADAHGAVLTDTRERPADREGTWLLDDLPADARVTAAVGLRVGPRFVAVAHAPVARAP